MALSDGFELGSADEVVFLGDFGKHIPPERLQRAGQYVVRIVNHREPEKDFATDYLAVVDGVDIKKRRFFMRRLGGAQVNLLPVTGEGKVLPWAEKRHIDDRGLGARVGIENLFGTLAHSWGFTSLPRMLPDIRHGYIMPYGSSHGDFSPKDFETPYNPDHDDDQPPVLQGLA